jgi:hypothetical protein
MKPICFVLLCICSSGCATLFNQRHQNIHIYAEKPFKLILKDDTLHSQDNQIVLREARQKTPLELSVVADHLPANVRIPAKNALAYWLNAYPSPMLWTGFLIDKKNPKRYAYPKHIYLSSMAAKGYQLYDPYSRKGQWFVQFSVPYINVFLQQPDQEKRQSNAGFWGLAAALEYHYSPQKSLRFSASVASDYFFPMPVPIERSGEYEQLFSTSVGVSQHHRIQRMSLGYGLLFAKNTWNLGYSTRFEPDPPSRNPVRKSRYFVGFNLPFEYQLSPRFWIGVKYQPMFLRVSQNIGFQYEHLISFGFGWNFRVKR